MFKYLNYFSRKFLPVSIYKSISESSLAKRILKGSIWVVCGNGASRLLTLLAMIMAARILGKDLFGEFAIIQSTIGVAGLFAGVGLGNTGTRFVANYIESNPSRVGRVIGMLDIVALILVTIAGSILFFSADYISEFIFNSKKLAEPLLWGIILMAALVINGVQNGALYGLERFDLVAILAITQAISLIIFIWFLTNTMGVSGTVLSLGLSACIVIFIGRFILLREINRKNIKITYFDWWEEKDIFTNYSLPMTLASLLATPVMWFSMIILANSIDGYGELGLFQAAYQWHGPMIYIPMAIMSASIPVLVQEWEAGRVKEFTLVISKIYRSLIIVGGVIVLIISFLSQWIMSFYGSEFEEAWLILVLLVAAAPLHALSKIFSGALLGMNKASEVLKVNIVWSFIMVILASTLVPKFGAFGLALSFFIAYLILAILNYSVLNFRIKQHHNYKKTKEYFI